VVIAPHIDGPNAALSTNAQTGLSKNRKFTGTGSDQDIVISSARAYVSALNKLLSWGMRRDMQQESMAAQSPVEVVAANGLEQEVKMVGAVE
jgi:2-isopropylmalate synthase